MTRPFAIGSKVRIREQCPAYGLLSNPAGSHLDPVGTVSYKRPIGDPDISGMLYVEVNLVGGGPHLLCIPPHQVSHYLEAI